jgi:hypothetical protein
MSAIDKRVQALAALAFAKIAELAKSTRAEDAARALAVIQRIVAAVQAGFARKLTPAEVSREIERAQKTLPSQLADNKKTILSEIDKKFPT